MDIVSIHAPVNVRLLSLGDLLDQAQMTRDELDVRNHQNHVLMVIDWPVCVRAYLEL